MDKNDTEIEKCKFQQYKIPILIDHIDINKMVVSYKISFGKNDFKWLLIRTETYTEHYQTSVSELFCVTVNSFHKYAIMLHQRCLVEP